MHCSTGLIRWCWSLKAPVRMRILHVVPTYFPAVRYGGPIYSVHALCQSLASAGHGVYVFTTSVDGRRDSNVPHVRSVDLDGVQVHYFRSRWLRRLFYSVDLRNHLNLIVGDFDVVHLHSVFLYPTWMGARAAVRAVMRASAIYSASFFAAQMQRRRRTRKNRAPISSIRLTLRLPKQCTER